MLEKIVEETNFRDFFIVTITAFALIAFWRGAWGLLDLYLFPENPALSFWASIAIGLGILLVLAWYKRDKLKRAEHVLTER